MKAGSGIVFMFGKSIAIRRKAVIVCLLMLALLAQAIVPVWMPSARAQELGVNLLVNGGFENAVGNAPTGWGTLGGWGNPEVSLSAAAARTGGNGIQISTQQSTNPWTGQFVPLEPGATYEVSAWLKASGIRGTGVGIKFEFYKGPKNSENHLGEYQTTKLILASDTTGEWQPISMQAEAPAEAQFVYIYFRLYGTGTVYYDDTSFVKLKNRPMVDMKTDEVFYYSDRTAGTVSADFHDPDGMLSDKHAEARIYRESNGDVVATAAHANASSPMTFVFDPSLMVKEEPYKVELKLLNGNGAVLETRETSIFRWDRPTAMRADGTLLVNGQPFFPVIGYHVARSEYDKVAEMGINTVQGGWTNNAQTMQDTLDAAEQNGLKVLVPLYYNLKVRENFDLMRDFVARFRNHPAVLAWMIMDEPITNGKTKDEIVEAYRIIRTIDGEHPTYIVEITPRAYEAAADATDIFTTDIYPLPANPISLVTERMKLAKQAAGADKPVWTILQSWRNPPRWPHLPTIEEVRNMAYQAILSGSQGLAFYAFNEAGTQETFVLRNSALWPVSLVSGRSWSS